MNGDLLYTAKCSKAREALRLLRAQGCEPRLVPYLDEPLDREALKDLLAQLGMHPRDLLRANEPLYAQLGLDDPELGDESILEAIARHPRLLQRPIYIRGDRAVLGRPPERVLELLPTTA